MKINTLGIVLSFYRKKEKLPLEKVCDGLCSAATLERIEKGERKADSLLGSLLLERIGREVTQFELLLNDEDYALWDMRGQIRNAMRRKDYTLMRQYLEMYRSMQKEYGELHEQFCLYYEVRMAVELKKEDCDKICHLALEALKLTKVNIDAKEITEKRLYTQTEIKLMLILIHYGYMNNVENAENTLLSLLAYIEYFYTERRREEIGIAIITELIELERKCKDDVMTVFYIDKGIALLSQGRGVKGLEKLHFLKAQILTDKYHNDSIHITEKQEIQRECLMAYCICEIMGYSEMMQEIEQFGKEKLSWQITELEM